MKKKIRNCLEIVTPRLWYKILRHRTYRTFRVVNDLTIYPSISLPYDPSSTYVTMFSAPPKNYKKIRKAFAYDENGIPLYEGKYYNLVSICQYGLTEFGYYKSTGEKKHLEHVETVCDWLLRNQEPETGYWIYRFPFYHEGTGYTLRDWACAMGQGQAASLLTRMWRLNHDERFLKAARNAFNMFDVPVKDGGLLAEFDGHMVFEEYPTQPPCFTLNGMIFATFGLYDYIQVKQDDKIEKLWNEAVRSIEYMLPLYDNDIGSSYDLSHFTARIVPRIAGNKYHVIHIALLQNLESLVPNATFEYYIRKWARMSGYRIKG